MLTNKDRGPLHNIKDEGVTGHVRSQSDKTDRHKYKRFHVLAMIFSVRYDLTEAYGVLYTLIFFDFFWREDEYFTFFLI